MENLNFHSCNSININSNLSMIEEFNHNLSHHDQSMGVLELNKSGNFENKDLRTIYDPIRGHIEFDQYVWDIIDTIEFQRLRNLKQLGNCHFIFPGGTHTRFEHSLGVAYLSNKLIFQLVKTLNSNFLSFSGYKTPKINEDFNIRAITLAGLLHDLGHGPFSHLFDRKVIKTLDPNITWEHEEGSARMFDYLIDNNGTELENDEIKLIKSLILGEISVSLNSDRYYDSWIYQIVANKKNSIDVDKFDYICRDSYHIGLQSASVDYDRIFNSAKIIDNNLCFNIKNDFNILSLFQSRYKLFKQVYTHKKSVAIDLMVKDILILSNEIFDFTKAIYDMEEYVKLDDGILTTIENFNDELILSKNIFEAQNLIKRIRQRDIYKFVGEILIPINLETKLNIEEIVLYNNPKDEFHIRVEDLELVMFSLDFGNAERDPFEFTYFYKSENPNVCFTNPSSKVSLAVPKVFKESYYYLYCKDKKKLERAEVVFESFKSNLKNEWDNYVKKEKFHTPIKNNKKEENEVFLSNKRNYSRNLEDIIKEKPIYSNNLK